MTAPRKPYRRKYAHIDWDAVSADATKRRALGEVWWRIARDHGVSIEYLRMEVQRRAKVEQSEEVV